MREFKGFNPKEIKLAKAGYCYHARESRKGQRPCVRDLGGKTNEDVIFDWSAYDTHVKCGIIQPLF